MLLAVSALVLRRMMAISDHQYDRTNPLSGENWMTLVHDSRYGSPPPEYRRAAHQVARQIGYQVDDGVYISVTGPTYETPAEIRAYKTLGMMLLGCLQFLRL